MKTVSMYASACRNCRYYQPEGKRGGMCEQLGVNVEGSWTCCPLAAHPFSNSCNEISDFNVLENTLFLDSKLTNSSLRHNLDTEVTQPQFV